MCGYGISILRKLDLPGSTEELEKTCTLRYVMKSLVYLPQNIWWYIGQDARIQAWGRRCLG